ncbi:polyamine aminopropyltransferase [Geitlerinema sp. PCC 7407]|uniref:polyamine aminopropyltransferase n=1 Tax=Geitlerinema sp. PCC 7407 TaxID=1173025 RepID=UPI00029FE2DA|nr:Spermine synthase [Geitlerinema sp. PCC 7407]
MSAIEPLNSLDAAPEPHSLTRQQWRLLLLTTAVSSSCGLAAELLLGTLASYLVGNQALAYGVAVGVFLAAMGLGAYLSRFVALQGDRPQQQRQLLRCFLQVELAIAPLTAFLPLGLFALFVAGGTLWPGLFLATVILGTLAGMEVPLLTRLVEQEKGLRDALSGVLALDYVGALCGSIAFPVLLLPLIGLFPSAAAIGSLPAFMVFFLGREFPRLRRWSHYGLAVAIALLVFAPLSVPLSDRLENSLYGAPVVTRLQSAYQRVVVTRMGRDVRLFLDGDLQLSTLDEYRYHEALVHPVMSANPHRRQVLLLGAGDGMALREVLKWPEVERVVVLELDPTVVKLAQRHPFLRRSNQGAFEDPRVEVQFADAFLAVPKLPTTFDVIIADFPDPDRDTIAKLYTQGFYQQLVSRLAPDGVMVTQASSSFFAPKVMACIAATLQSVGMAVHPYSVDVPSFGPWGFVLAARSPLDLSALTLPVETRFLTEPLLAQIFVLPKDMQPQPVEINRLARPVIVRYQSDPHWAVYY